MTVKFILLNLFQSINQALHVIYPRVALRPNKIISISVVSTYPNLCPYP